MSRKRTFFYIILLIMISQYALSPAAEQVSIFTYRAAESDNDSRYDYDTKLLQLALDNTEKSDGPYKLVPSPIMNYARAHAYLENNSLPNFIVKLSYEPGFADRDMSYIPFPVDLGIVGYRVCFTHPGIESQLKKVDSLEDFRTTFTHGQGTGWADVDILQKNGFTVYEVTDYERLFTMVANSRFDLFCRGANELLGEYEKHQDTKNLTYDKSVALFYPLPRFFYMNSANSAALDRLYRGIMIAYNNGSLQKLWHEQYKESIEFAGLDKRKIFMLHNPLIDSLDFDYKQFFYKPKILKQL